MTTAILAQILIDGTGREPIKDAVVIVEQGRIVKVTSKANVSLSTQSYDIVDTNNGVLLPGLIDSHSHIFYITNKMPDAREEQGPEYLVHLISGGLLDARSYISQGVTSIRNLGTEKNLDLGLRNLIAQGKIIGPRIFGSGRPIVMTGRKPFAENIEVNCASDARRAAREQLRNGADVIKLFASAGSIAGGQEQLTIEEMQAAAIEAHKAGRTVTAHAIGTQSIKNAILAGVDSVEHATLIDEEGIALMKERDIVMVPTLSVGRTMANMSPETAVHFGLPADVSEVAHTSFEHDSKALRMAHQVGIRIAAGTDPVLQDTIAGECSWLHKAGLSPMEVIIAATRTGADVLNVDDRLGTIEEGKFADIIALQGNPLEDITALQRVSWVFKEGQLHKSPQI